MFEFKRMIAAIITAAILFGACGSESTPEQASTQEVVRVKEKLLELVGPNETNIHMVNLVEEDNKYNYYTDGAYYSGTGVCLGDINKDGLLDIFFTGNRVYNKLYLNKGDFVFEDISEASGIDPSPGDRATHWASGASMVDINGDGYLDFYVARGSKIQENPDDRRNQLMINNGDLTFTDKAAEYGLDDAGYGIHSAWFDYDKDGDLDMYLTTHSPKFAWEEGELLKNVPIPDEISHDKLYQNQGDGTFKDVTGKALVSQLSFGLGLGIGDLNEDGWPDIYVANDYLVPDIYYENNKDGTFTNRIQEKFKHTALFGMGLDISDANNDGHLDVVIADMTAADNYRQKVMMAPMNPELFWWNVDNGAGYQLMHNVLQINNGNGSFSDISQMSNIHFTDWSWATLFMDLENDGYKDLLITNGYLRDVNDKDYLNSYDEMASFESKFSWRDIEDITKSTKLNNYMLRSNGDLTYSDVSSEYGFTVPSFSSGAAYGDIDKDGDLDLVIANINDKPFVYRNKAIEQGVAGNYLRIQLKGTTNNPSGFGAKIWVSTEDKEQFQEMYVTRGYLSSVEPVAHVGLDASSFADVKVVWPNGKITEVKSVEANQVLVLDIKDASGQWKPEESRETLMQAINNGPTFTHKEEVFNDYETEILLPHKMSQFGPYISVGDVNGDGQDDFYIGGAGGQAGKLFVQAGVAFKSKAGPWAADKSAEDLGSTFFDADADGDLDLYVVSGSNEFGEDAAELNDRLYINDGKGNYSRSKDALPERLFSGSCVVAADYDGDGDQDLFVGGRQTPQKYPYAGKSALLENEGGQFTDVTLDLAPELVDVGMVTSAEWSDFDQDQDLDLIVVGEWMPITIFENQDGTFQNNTVNYGLDEQTGWWNKIVQADFDGDGDMDYVVGNYGLNSKFKATVKEPLQVYCTDFDESGTLDIVLGYYNQGVCFPVRGKQCSSEQMPMIKKKFPTYDAFGKATLTDVYGETLDKALNYKARNFASVYIENTPDGFVVKQLPFEAQASTVFGLLPGDLDKDGHLDILICGNFYMPEVETGRNDASIGLYLRGDGQGNFEPVPVTESGFFAWNDARDLAILQLANGESMILVANNDDKLQSFKLRQTKL